MHYPFASKLPLLFALLVLNLPLRADAPATARAGIQAAYDQICADFERRDIGAAMSFFSPDYLATDEHGRLVSREETERQYRDLNNRITSMHSHWTLSNVAPAQGGMLADMDMYSDGTGRKKVLFFQVDGTFTSEMRVRDFWVETSQGWRIKRRLILLHQTDTHPG